MDIKLLNESPVTLSVFQASDEMKILGENIYNLLSATNLTYGKEIIFHNPETDIDERSTCFAASYEKDRCDTLPNCRKKTPNPYMKQFQLPYIEQSFLTDILARYNDPAASEEQKAYLGELYAAVFNMNSDGTYTTNQQPAEYCEHKKDFVKISDDGLLQLPPLGGKYYHLKGIYNSVGLTKCVMLAPVDDPSAFYISFKPFDAKFDTVKGVVESAVTAKALLCDNAFDTIYKKKINIFGDAIEIDSSWLPFESRTNVGKIIQAARIHRGLLGICLKIFEDEKFQNTLRKALLYETENGEVGWAHAKIVICGYSLGAAMSHVMTFLISLIFLPYMERFITLKSNKPVLNCATFGAPRTGNFAYEEYMNAMGISILNFISSKIQESKLYVDPAACFPQTPEKTKDGYVNIGATCILLPKGVATGNIMLDNSHYIMNQFNYQRDCVYAATTALGIGFSFLPGLVAGAVQKFLPKPDEGAENWGELHNIDLYTNLLFT